MAGILRGGFVAVSPGIKFGEVDAVIKVIKEAEMRPFARLLWTLVQLYTQLPLAG